MNTPMVISLISPNCVLLCIFVPVGYFVGLSYLLSTLNKAHKYKIVSTDLTSAFIVVPNGWRDAQLIFVNESVNWSSRYWIFGAISIYIANEVKYLSLHLLCLFFLPFNFFLGSHCNREFNFIYKAFQSNSYHHLPSFLQLSRKS